MVDLSGRAQRRHDCIRALEEERRKIEAFQRELPLCLQLVTRAIDCVREQMGDDERANDAPVLEEFIPLKPSLASTSSEGRRSEAKAAATVGGSETKPDWLRSVQLWDQQPDTVLKAEPPKKPITVSLNKTGGAFQPFEREKHVTAPPAATAAASDFTTSRGGGGGTGRGGDMEKEEDQSPLHRKARRRWSPELHRRFLHALERLGGSHVATPKQIRELMEVDGLTNDEVKSHLQKYRLHTRRPNPGVQSSSRPQFVLVGGLVVPPASPPGNGACASPNGIYAPVASRPSGLRSGIRQSHSGGRRSGDATSMGDDDDATDSTSPTASASSQTTTASPPF
ncbi:hypothetical protein OPV22_019862 [Ensete ventricosum]|uniref:HTH myb-type domain-containing protein n=1 Tax=Ensete ventricosum TaxID=4639 RepID=A0AAV8P9P2_ENSVE|nr:hypothetical protein OPV22_019862 [Ensete ventricosum]